MSIEERFNDWDEDSIVIYKASEEEHEKARKAMEGNGRAYCPSDGEIAEGGTACGGEGRPATGSGIISGRGGPVRMVEGRKSLALSVITGSDEGDRSLSQEDA